MNELWLIAHKVRGEAAFDVATKMGCPMCDNGCVACGHLQYWWIIPTSGHRAYPWWSVDLLNIDDTFELSFECTSGLVDHPGPMPTDLPDHYRPKAEPKRSIDISSLKKPFTMNRRV